jgi:hypothetical protein
LLRNEPAPDQGLVAVPPIKSESKVKYICNYFENYWAIETV